MLKLDNHFNITKDVISSSNLCSKFSEDDLRRIGLQCQQNLQRDESSRTKWMKRVSQAMDLAMQISKDKSFPWPNCSNIAFPLVTIATLQFHARAYPSLVNGSDLVRYRSVDGTSESIERAERVSRHMSYQLLEEDHDWEEQHDRLLINLPIVGTVFKKTYYNGGEGMVDSDLVLAQDLVLDYFAKSVDGCARKTHKFPMYRNEMHTRIMRKVFRDVRGEGWYSVYTPPQGRQEIDKRHGVTPPIYEDDSPFQLCEQHCSIDFDDDGYAEPYIVTFEEVSGCVLRIVARFDREEDIERDHKGNIISIRAVEYFTKYSFIPSPDGGIYDIGFGVLLGPLNESVNSIINQLVDAGTMSNSAGGFLGRGAKIRGGVYTFAPLEWKRVDSTGDDLKKSIFPLPVREPSAVLFQLLSLLVNYTERISGSTDMMMGENPGQNTPAQTSQTMVEQGMKIYSVLFKRVWRAMKEEFRKVYIINSIHLPISRHYGASGLVHREDYLQDPRGVAPNADPSILSDSQRLVQAQAVKQSSMTTPGYSVPDVEKNYLRALRVDNIEVLYPGPDKVPPIPNPKMMVEEAKLKGKQMQFQHEQAMFMAELQDEQAINRAKITELEAKAAKELAEAGGVQAGHQIAAFEAMLGAMKHHDDTINKRIELIMKSLETGNDQSRGMGGMASLSGNEAGNAAPASTPGGP